ncbi:MAG: alginate lyase family protein [Planctomycetota bacterium]
MRSAAKRHRNPGVQNATGVANGNAFLGACFMQSERQAPGPSTWSQRAVRWWYIFRYYRMSQLAMRLVSMVQRGFVRMTGGGRYARPPKVVPKPREHPGFASLARGKLSERRARNSALNVRGILEGRYRFLNSERALPDPVDWRLESWPEAPRLWRFHLHYHEFLLDLAAEGARHDDRTLFDRAWDLVAQWIDSNRPSDGRVFIDAWHPYCISRRLPVWLHLWVTSPPARELGNAVLSSIFSQALYLERHLEWDVRGNHLLENARAMVLIGAFLDGPDAERWLLKGARILRKELAKQLLPHGEHFERSPMYHAQMLEAVLDVRDAVAEIMPHVARSCEKTALKMADFLRGIAHPDGEIPLLGDACLGETVPLRQLTARAARSGSGEHANGCERNHTFDQSPRSRFVGDYWIHRQGDDFLLFDAGPVGPDHLPAHAHADLLTFEASIQGHRLFVDSGVFNYQDDSMRRYCRSSRSHNVLQIDGRDQCDVWSRFRMGYRGWPSGSAAGESSGFHWARAQHNAYRRLGVRNVGRWIACRLGGPWLCVDWAEGTGRHDLSIWLHLHPDVAAEKVADDEVRLEVKGIVLKLRYLTAGQIAITEGWYCPELGRRERAPIVRWTAFASLPAVCGWSLAWNNCRGVASIDQNDREKILMRWIDNDQSLLFQPVGKALST